MTDKNLLKLIKDNDSEAFKEIAEKYFRRVYLFVSKASNDPKIVEEIVTSIFKRVWIRRHQQNTDSLDQYIFKLTCMEISHVIRPNTNNNFPALIKLGIKRLYLTRNRFRLWQAILK